MNKDGQQLDLLNLEVPAGTEIQWHLSCDIPVKYLKVKTDRIIGENGEVEIVEAEVDDTGKQVTFNMSANEPFKYTFMWTELESGKDFEYGDVQHSVRVVADSIPEVELMQPLSDGLATVQKTIKMTARARDDHGLEKAWLVYSINGSKEDRLPIRDFKGVPSQEFSFAWEMKKTLEKLKPGHRVAFAIEVVDRNPIGQRKRRSATRQFTVVELEGYLDWLRGELSAQRDEIKRVRDREITAAVKVKQIKAQETPSS